MGGKTIYRPKNHRSGPAYLDTAKTTQKLHTRFSPHTLVEPHRHSNNVKQTTSRKRTSFTILV
ncbi:MAG: hypothetical protein COA42_22445 [Alteromonadaceae bacterium]|nr:MAG: hypothetical protein COA42_22445 [Alteromonadaceae bacterium]